MNGGESNVLGALEGALDILLNTCAFGAAYYFLPLLYGSVIRLSHSFAPAFLPFALSVASSLVYRMFGCYRPIPYINTSYPLKNTVYANTLAFPLFSLIVYLLNKGSEAAVPLTLWILLSGAVSTVLLILKKRFIILAVRLIRRRRDIIKRVIIIGDGTEAARAFVNEVIRDKYNGIMLLGTVGDMKGEAVGCEPLGGFDGLSDIIKREKPDYAVFAFEHYDKKTVMRLVEICDGACVKVYFLPVVFGFLRSAGQLEHIGTLPFINLHTTPLDDPFNAFVKRITDFLGALILIILTSPIMLFAAIGTKLSSPGAVLFRQVRVGKMGKRFVMLKFRSMREAAEEEEGWSTGEDPRKTRFGNLMRRTSLDELPQLFNVLRGDMSLVGPRPELPRFVEGFKREIPLYMVKHYVKPGMTGLAQIKGLRGDTSIADRINEDIAYIEGWSLWLDVLILLKTPFRLINKSERFTPRSKSSSEEGGADE